ncbi:MAG: heme exporter protein CcmB [Leptospiraceae bacterium]|nr:heme exporter protein CcmB [Leptospiraceae bacterium]MCP5500659.1 heme exporter protein CcmB [Leptospiraceae bacterium]
MALKELILKEFRLIGRAKNGILSMFVLMLSLIFIFHFSLERTNPLSQESLIGLKWSIVFILSFVFIGQSNWEERESGAFWINQIYLPSHYPFLVKSFVIWLILLVIEIALLFLFSVFFQSFQLSSKSIFHQLIYLTPGTLSLSFLGNMLSKMSHATRLKEIVLPLLLIPLSMPVLIFGMEAEQKILHQDTYNVSTFLIMLFFTVFYGSLGSIFVEIFQEE